jgi:hypothetical protein
MAFDMVLHLDGFNKRALTVDDTSKEIDSEKDKCIQPPF